MSVNRFPWRAGRQVGRTVYDGDDQLIGVMDSVELARRVVVSVNHARAACESDGHMHRRLEESDRLECERCGERWVIVWPTGAT